MSHAIIIGAGLGGLECGYILAHEGWDVTVLEKNAQIGGCLQTFKRQGTTFDTGFHYVGGLGEGEILHILFDYFSLNSLPWERINPECVDEIHLGEKTYRIPSGRDRFISYLISKFPDEEKGIRDYVSRLKSIGDSIFHLSSPERDTSAMGISTHEFLCSTFSDPTLISLLESDVARMDYTGGNLPLYVHGQIRNSFIQSAWRLGGGGSLLAEKLAGGITCKGGKIITSAEVIEIKEVAGEAKGVVTADGRTFDADLVISDAHPQVTLKMLGDCPSVRKSFKNRISALENSQGALTINIRLKEETLKYRDCGIYIRKNPEDNGIMVFFSAPSSGVYSPSVDIICPVGAKVFGKWMGIQGYSNDKEYQTKKESLAKEFIDLAAEHIPGLKEAIDKAYVSTPLTYLRYTGTPEGSAFGIKKDSQSPLTTFLSPKTPLKNLFLTGQSLNLHGVLGVTLTSAVTCSAALGQNIIDKIIKR